MLFVMFKVIDVMLILALFRTFILQIQCDYYQLNKASVFIHRMLINGEYNYYANWEIYSSLVGEKNNDKHNYLQRIS